MKRREDKVEDYLALFSALSSEELVEAEKRAFHRLRSESVDAVQGPAAEFRPHRPGWNWRPFAAAAGAAVVLGILIVLIRAAAFGPYAVVESAAGNSLQAGRRIHVGDSARTGDTGAILALEDGSHIEMRSQSELALQTATDGVLLQLNNGSIIVSAAKQRSGHLYVRTKDVTISVVGTVFLVNTEKVGSRVAVIQGEVRVQQGTDSKKLLPGDQVATNPLMEAQGVKEEISWSRNAVEHLALLQQSTSRPATPAGLEFEVASLRPLPKTAPVAGSADRLFRCKGVDGIFHATTGDLVNLSVLSSELAALPASSAVPQGRCIGIVHPTQLVAQAYNTLPVRITSSLRDWPEYYQIEAKAPDPANVTRNQLRQMLQSLLADRFAFKMHIETKEGPGYNLRVGKNGPKFKAASGEEELLAPIPSNGGNTLTFKGKFQLKTFAESLWMFAGRVPVIDKTDLSGVYDLVLTLDFGGGGGGTRGGGGPAGGGLPGLAAALQDQLGLVLESTKVPIDNLIVDHIEKPTEN